MHLDIILVEGLNHDDVVLGVYTLFQWPFKDICDTFHGEKNTLSYVNAKILRGT